MELWDGCDREISSLLRPSIIPLLPRCFLQSAVLKLGGSRARYSLMVGKILQPEIKSMIDARDFGALREVFREWPPADVAEVILDLPEDEQVIIFRVLPHALAADVFEYLDFEAQQKLLRAMAHEQVVGDSERNVAGRSHGAARRIAERSGAPAHLAAHAGRTPRRAVVAWLSGRQRWPIDDAGFHRMCTKIGRCSKFSISCANTARTAKRLTLSTWSMTAAN